LFFWPGFFTGVLLLSLVTCGGLAFLSGVVNLEMASFQQQGLAWTPPPLTPTTSISETTTVDSGNSVNTAAGAFRTGDIVRNITSSRVNIRREPGYLSKPAGDIIGQALPDQAVTILEGPVTSDNLAWWRVRHTSSGGLTTDGWMAEATASGVQILEK
jgi:hypothetical protein